MSTLTADQISINVCLVCTVPGGCDENDYRCLPLPRAETCAEQAQPLQRRAHLSSPRVRQTHHERQPDVREASMVQMRRTITESRRLKICLKCGSTPAVADGDSLALYCAKCHREHADRWRKFNEQS